MTEPTLRDLLAAATPETTPPFDAVVQRAGRRRARRRAAVGVGCAVALLAVGGGTWAALDHREPSTERALDPAATSTAAASTAGTPGAPERPAWNGKGGMPVFLELDTTTRLEPWSFCSTTMCADGRPVGPFVDAGDRDVVQFAVPEDGWKFTANFTPIDEEGYQITNSTVLNATVRPLGPYAFEIDAPTEPGNFRVDLHGRGPSGDGIVSFGW